MKQEKKDILVPKETAEAKIKPYYATITAKNTGIYETPSKGAKVVCELRRGFTYIITEEEKGFGKLESGAGWILLKDTELVENI